MRSEKGITLVALIGIFVLIVILAGISFSIAAKGNNEEQVPTNDIVTNIDDEYEDEEIVVDPTVGTSTTETEEEVAAKESTNTVANEVE